MPACEHLSPPPPFDWRKMLFSCCDPIGHRQQSTRWWPGSRFRRRYPVNKEPAETSDKLETWDIKRGLPVPDSWWSAWHFYFLFYCSWICQWRTVTVVSWGEMQEKVVFLEDLFFHKHFSFECQTLDNTDKQSELFAFKTTHSAVSFAVFYLTFSFASGSLTHADSSIILSDFSVYIWFNPRILDISDYNLHKCSMNSSRVI